MILDREILRRVDSVAVSDSVILGLWTVRAYLPHDHGECRWHQNAVEWSGYTLSIFRKTGGRWRLARNAICSPPRRASGDGERWA